MNRDEKKLIDATIAWWEYKRFGADPEYHLNNPTINCPTVRGQTLATAVAEFIKSQQNLIAPPKPKKAVRKVAKKKRTTVKAKTPVRKKPKWS